MIKKIAIVGNAGSGKTTLATDLHKKYGIPVYHIDQYYWLPNFQRVEPEIFKKIYTKLCAHDTWILEGAYIRGFQQRAHAADIVIFLDIPRRTCLWRVLKRTVCNWGAERPDSPKGCKETIFARKYLEFLQWVFDFDKKHKQAILGVLQELSGKKPIFIVKTAEDYAKLLE